MGGGGGILHDCTGSNKQGVWKPPTPHILTFDILIRGSGQDEVCKKYLQALPILSSHRFFTRLPYRAHPLLFYARLL